MAGKTAIKNMHSKPTAAKRQTRKLGRKSAVASKEDYGGFWLGVDELQWAK